MVVSGDGTAGEHRPGRQLVGRQRRTVLVDESRSEPGAPRTDAAISAAGESKPIMRAAAALAKISLPSPIQQRDAVVDSGEHAPGASAALLRRARRRISATRLRTVSRVAAIAKASVPPISSAAVNPQRQVASRSRRRSRRASSVLHVREQPARPVHRPLVLHQQRQRFAAGAVALRRRARSGRIHRSRR